jgi:hypothetical protein
MHECNPFYTNKKGMAFRVLIFTKLTNTQEDYVQNSYTDFYLNLKMDIELKDRNSYVHEWIMGFSASIFTTFKHSLNYVDIFCAESDLNRVKMWKIMVNFYFWQ